MNWEIIAAVMAGNFMTVLFLYGAVQFTKKERVGEWSWINWAMIAVPIFVLLVSLYFTAQAPQFLDAIASQQ